MTKIAKENEEIECPVCRQKHIITFYNSVNVKVSPELKEKVFNGEINTLPCAKGVLIGEFLYVDGNRWIWVYPVFKANQEENIKRQLQEIENKDRKMFGGLKSEFYLVFGYEQFLKLSENLDLVENSQKNH